ncbi:MAG: ABC transporter ATP-binding protein, partial [Elusimicrobia bacterium]
MGEERSFYWRLTGRQNLEFFASLYGLSSGQASLGIEEAAGIFAISELDKPYQECSTGTKHRLALARSFLNKASVLFLDEPTRSLDPAAASSLREVIKGYARSSRGRTVFFTTHNVPEAELLA